MKPCDYGKTATIGDQLFAKKDYFYKTLFKNKLGIGHSCHMRHLLRKKNAHVLLSFFCVSLSNMEYFQSRHQKLICGVYFPLSLISGHKYAIEIENNV